jgi:hypothetical protein
MEITTDASNRARCEATSRCLASPVVAGGFLPRVIDGVVADGRECGLARARSPGPPGPLSCNTGLAVVNSTAGRVVRVPD